MKYKIWDIKDKQWVDNRICAPNGEVCDIQGCLVGGNSIKYKVSHEVTIAGTDGTAIKCHIGNKLSIKFTTGLPMPHITINGVLVEDGNKLVLVCDKYGHEINDSNVISCRVISEDYYGH